MDQHFLTPLFAPQSIVLFAGSPDDAASQTSQARALTEALQAQRFTGTLVAVDIHTSGTLADLAQTKADLAIIALPAKDLAAALEIAGRMACKAALVISTGISAEQSAELHKIARRESMHLLGPNGLGLQRPQLKLNASTCGTLPKTGPLALVSQSGALTASMLDWAANNAVGFSSVVSLGPHAAVDIAQVLDFLANDAQTHSIIVYLEGISNARRFMSALRSAANAKPVVVLKAGRKPAGNAAAQTHSGAIVGSDDVFEAALRRAFTDRLGLEMKSGKLLTGSDRIAEHARGGMVAWLAHASDASTDGSRKLDQAWRVGQESEGSGMTGLTLPLDRMALSVALGRDNVVHLALTDPAAAGRIAAPLQRLLRFLGQATETGLNEDKRTALPAGPTVMTIED